MPSTLSKLKATASGNTARKALAFVSEGGIEYAQSAGSLLRSHQQIHDIRRRLAGPSDTDPNFSLMLMCKESQGQKNAIAFVQLVNGTLLPMMVLAHDWTLDDLVCFCMEYTILGVDPTLSNLKYFGSDGEDALVKELVATAFSQCNSSSLLFAFPRQH